MPSLQIADESGDVTVKTIEIPRPAKKPTKTLTPATGRSAVKKAAQTA